jgi:LysR family transcriptional regulator, glycine cleavage system transcriptional activator
VASAYDRLPLNALRVFEAVAARLSFAEAAEALHVTPAAVSMQVRTLEEYLQVPLFRRSGRKVALTSEGEQLLPGIRRGLDELEAALNELRKDRKGGQINISMLASFLQKWLLPRLPDLRDQHPDVELRVHTSRDSVDFSRSDFHAAIRLGSGDYKGLYSEKVMDEWLVAVAAPAVLAKHGPLMSSQPLERYPLLQSTDEPWIHWREVGAGEPTPVRGSVLDDSVSVIMAAEQGLGFALVRWSLAASDLQAGRLAFASPVALPYRWAYHFVCPKSYVAMPKIAKFLEWLRGSVKAFHEPHTLMAEKGITARAAFSVPAPEKPATAAKSTTSVEKTKPAVQKVVQVKKALSGGARGKSAARARR